MSPTLSHSRLFKATRRFIVAEITLIVVIVVMFTWSTYVLLKLFAGDSDSIFGFSVGTTPPAANNNQNNHNNNKLPASLTNAQDSINERETSDRLISQLSADSLNLSPPVDRLVSQSQIVPHVRQPDLRQQLASYKSQILKELLARQERLLSAGDGGGGQLASLMGLRGGGLRPRSGQRMIESDDQNEHLPARDGPSLESNLVYLNDAPSLMQLSNGDTSDGQTTTTNPSPDPDQDSGEVGQDSGGSEPFEPTQPTRAQRDQLDGPLAPTTTEQPPPVLGADLETTTLEPAPQEANDNEVATQDAGQTTTSSPMIEPRGADQSDSGESEPQSQGDDDGGGQNSVESDQRPSEQADDEERARKAVKTIDEEVDRMTQPSLGVASRQIKPANFLKSSVQFDDALAMSLDDTARGRHHLEPPPSSSRTLPKNHKLFDDDPPPDGAKVTKNSSRRQDLRDSDQHQDLLTADNFHKSPPHSPPSPTLESKVSGDRSRLSPATSVLERASRRLDSDHLETSSFRPLEPKQSLNDLSRIKVANRQKEQGHFRRKRSTMDQMDLAHFDLELDSKPRNSKTTRRSDDVEAADEEEDEEEPSGGGDDEEAVGRQEAASLVSPIAKQLNQFGVPLASQTSGQDMSTSEPTFEQLLAHKQLLDALQQNSPPPPPVKWAGNQQMKPVASGPTNTNSSNKPIQSDEPQQSADTHYSVDHGLLLYPAADEDHHYGKKSHKSHKASKKKAKKKMTVAVKKGGHKSKKHKKEEKKYHKEKKFKGAKKGKKMKKGEGGKGGKKGKKLYKDKGYKKKGFKNTYVKNEFGSKKSYFDEFRDKDFKKKWKKSDDKYKYAQMKKWQAKDVKKAKKMKDHGAKFKKYDKGKWKKQKFADMSSGSKKSHSKHEKDF